MTKNTVKTTLLNTVFGLALTLALAGPQTALAYITTRYDQSSLSLSERVSETRSRCFGERYSFPRITFDDPRGFWVDLYRPSKLSRATMLIYDPLTHGLGGAVQSGIDWVLGDGDAARGVRALKAMGNEARQFARKNNMGRLESICLASCVVNHMIEGTEEIPHMLSLNLALADGVGDCKIYAEAMDVVAARMGISLRLATSWEHAFNRVRHLGKDYFFDATRWDGYSCNFIPKSFYD